jgi:hypothetical protein
MARGDLGVWQLQIGGWGVVVGAGEGRERFIADDLRGGFAGQNEQGAGPWITTLQSAAACLV